MGSCPELVLCGHWGQLGCARSRAPCVVIRDDCGCPSRANSLSVHPRGQDGCQQKDVVALATSLAQASLL